MMQLNNEQIKQSFHNEMILIYKRITKELKYKSPRLIDLINKHGGYEAAIKYLATESSVQDFAVLWENERLDLSIEALIVSEKYRGIFDESIVKMCDKKLSEYSYAPLKVEEPEEEEIIFYDDLPSKEIIEQVQKEVAEKPRKLYQYCDYDISVTTDMWKEVVVNTKIVSVKNLDLLLRVYLIGDDVTAEDFCKEEGYTATYPYKDVVSAMAKRIKAYFKIDVPMDAQNKPLWWHLIFIGGLKDNKCFEWSLRSNLRRAIKELIELGLISLDGIEVHTHKNVIPKQEKVVKTEETVKGSKSDKSSSDTSDFDKLFASIMGIESDDEEQSPSKEEAVVEEISEMQTEKESAVLKCVEESIVSSDNTKDIITTEENLTNKERIKKECIDYYGAICDICGFDYGYTYGESYESEIEVHNTTGYKDDKDEILEDSDPIKDLIPICRNCHHILHNSKQAVSIDKLREMIKV